MEQPGWPGLFNRCGARRLTWWPELGVGYYPVETGNKPYDAEYFSRYQRQADTQIGRALMTARLAFVQRHWKGVMLDMGIGSGAFIELRNKIFAAHQNSTPDRPATYGYDVNPQAVEWLADLFWDPYQVRVDAISLWDVLEHIHEFPILLANVTTWVFVSIPIFKDSDHVLRSKHYRKDEHCWYFTADGLIRLMRDLGFACVEQNDIETQLGREDIGSFAFRRA